MKHRIHLHGMVLNKAQIRFHVAALNEAQDISSWGGA